MLAVFYATILLDDYPGTGDYYSCAIVSMDLAEARNKSQYENKSLRLRADWDPMKIEDKTITHVPTGMSYPAAIYEMTPRQRAS